ncbi:MAG TPA: alpha/beta fold hydrolase, partial [Kofleriaceae bacterium]|nr:alpha/beta fold hydrolase [Kofleriaceae bacterium]
MNATASQPSVETDRPGPILIEQVLADIWRFTLDLEAVELDASFFSLGGDSLLAMVTIEQIKQRLGWRLNLGELMRLPSIRALAASRATPQLANDERPLVRLSNRGDLPPLVLLHPETGLASAYGKLVRWLGRGRGCYAVQSPLFSGEELPPTIEQQAELYAELLYEEFADEEIHLAGWSGGAALAYELARIGPARQLGVSKLVLIDPPPPAAPEPPRELLLARFAEQLAAQSGRDQRQGLGAGESDVASLVPWVFGAGVELSAGSAALGAALETYRTCTSALARYTVGDAPDALDVPALLLHGAATEAA